jgi:thiosulfate/3-mercaptopyruvate sulfurtransferase
MQEAAQSLISAESLALRLSNAALVVVDVRIAADGGREAYEEGHIPGAVFSDYAGDGWRKRVGEVPGLLPSGSHLSQLLGKLGIRPASRVVLVPAGTSANDLAASARIYWTLKTAGHDAVSVLDGGWRNWIRDASRPIETGLRAPKACDPYPVEMRETWRASAQECVQALATRAAGFIDARATSYFEGSEKAPEALRAGRIPGAISCDYAGLFDPVRRALKPRAELERLFAAIPANSIISYCNTGHTAALNWFVLSEILGREEVRLYDGSMTEWTQDPTRPVETG